ncbi:MAG: M23 family metallopeptidase [Clostridia bacterium]|nr:M23 family metallopeptidase [Clostridia bacterium]
MKRKFYKRKDRRLFGTIIMQILICIFIVIAVIGLKKANMTFTNRIFNVVESGFNMEFDFKEASITAFNTIKKAPELPVKIAGLFKKTDYTYGFVPPVDQGNIISTFGSSYDSVTETGSFQRGVDYFSQEEEIIVYSIGDGVVEEVANSTTYGDYIKVNHGNDIFSIYAKCTNIYVEKEQKVSKGDILASVNTYEDSQSFFHFELWIEGEIVDPNDYINLK